MSTAPQVIPIGPVAEFRNHELSVSKLPLDLASVYQELDETITIFDRNAPITDREAQINDIADHTVRSAKRAAITMEPESLMCTNGLVGWALELPESTDEAIGERVKDFLRPKFSAAYSSSCESQIQFFSNIVVAKSRRVQQLASLSSATVNRLAQEVGGDSLKKFALMKLLSAKLHESPGVIDKRQLDIFSLQALFTFHANQSDQEEVVPSISAGLESGEFDGLIAHDLLSDAMDRADEGGQNSDDKRSQDLRNWILLTASCMEQDVSFAIDSLASGKHLALWPESIKQLLDTAKAKYIYGLRSSHAAMRDDLAKELFLPWNGTEEILDVPIRKMAESLAEVTARLGRMTLNRHQKQAGTRGSVATLRAQRLEAIRNGANASGRAPKRRRLVSAASVATDSSPEASKIAAEPICRELVLLSPDGETYPEGSTEYKNFIDSHVESHRGEPGFEEDIKAMQDWLKKIDLSSGLPRGVKKYQMDGGSSKLSNRKIYELKTSGPDGAVGLPTQSSIAKKTRILFSMNKGKVQIMGICDKDDFAALQRSLGIPGRSRTR